VAPLSVTDARTPILASHQSPVGNSGYRQRHASRRWLPGTGGGLSAFLAAEGLALDHIEPHGSLYGMVAREEQLMDAVCDVDGVAETDTGERVPSG
jgi:hypothetical protein